MTAFRSARHVTTSSAGPAEKVAPAVFISSAAAASRRAKTATTQSVHPVSPKESAKTAMTAIQPPTNPAMTLRMTPIRPPAAKPVLRFSPPAWSKLLYLRDKGPTEIGAFGIALPDDPLFVTDIRLVLQICSPSYVSFDDVAVADFYDEQVDLGRRPEQFS